MDKLVSIVHSFDREKCGFILLSGIIIEVDNIHENPINNFAIADKDIDYYVLDNIAAFWHSHIENDSNLSIPDYKSFLKYPNHYHVIFCYNDFTIYKVRNNLVIRVDHASNSEFSSRFAKLISS